MYQGGQPLRKRKCAEGQQGAASDVRFTAVTHAARSHTAVRRRLRPVCNCALFAHGTALTTALGRPTDIGESSGKHLRKGYRLAALQSKLLQHSACA
jgi:hypothetical protein